MKELKAQKDAATAASSGGAARRTQQRQAKGQREHETEEESSKIPVDMSAEQYAQLSQARGNKYVELRQGAPIALTQQALPVGSNHRRKWKKKDYSSDSGSEDDDETYMPASNLVNLPGGGWGKAAGAGNLGDAGGSSGKRSSAGSISKGDIGTVVGPCEEESIAEVDVPGAAPCCTW